MHMHTNTSKRSWNQTGEQTRRHAWKSVRQTDTETYAHPSHTHTQTRNQTSKQTSTQTRMHADKRARKQASAHGRNTSHRHRQTIGQARAAAPLSPA
eukprot:1764475-Alexandrium_andersonii.AAC.1